MKYFEKISANKLVKVLKGVSDSPDKMSKILKTVRARGYYPGSKRIKELGGQMEGRAVLHTSDVSRDGLAVHKVFDHKSSLVTKESISEKERIFKALKGEKQLAKFYGTPHNNPEIHKIEFLHEPVKRKSIPIFNLKSLQENAVRRAGDRLSDAHSGNIINGKLFDFIPASLQGKLPGQEKVVKVLKEKKFNSKQIHKLFNDENDPKVLKKIRKFGPSTRDRVRDAQASLINSKGARPTNTLMRESYSKKREPILLGPKNNSKMESQEPVTKQTGFLGFFKRFKK